MRTFPATVLVIEKHPLMRAAIVNAIADEADLTICAVAANGQDTRQVVEALRPEIILFTIGGPGQEDLETIRVLQALSPHAAILALTSAETPGQNEAALKYGADAAISKTVPRAELLQTLRAIKSKMEHNEEEAPDSQSGE